MDAKCLKNREMSVPNLSNVEFQNIEYEADMYAISLLMSEIYGIKNYLVKFWNQGTTLLETISMLLLCFVIAILDVDYNLDILSSDHPPAYIRCFNFVNLMVSIILSESEVDFVKDIMSSLIDLLICNREFHAAASEHLKLTVKRGDVKQIENDIVTEIRDGNRDILGIVAFTYFSELCSSYTIQYFKAKDDDLSSALALQEMAASEYEKLEAQGIHIDHELAISVMISTEPRDYME